MKDWQKEFNHALWRIYNRPQRPLPDTVGDLPWSEPDFSLRMLAEHLDERHGAASRVAAERQLQIDWLVNTLAIKEGTLVCDLTCGPGLYAVPLAQRGAVVTAVDFAPAAIAHARQLAVEANIMEQCTFVEADIHTWLFPEAHFDTIILLYGQLAVFTRPEAQTLLQRACQALRPGGRLCLELLNPAHTDKSESSWWFSDDKGLWGRTPFINLGERFWDSENRASVERYHVLHLETGQMDTIYVRDYVYESEEVKALLHASGFTNVTIYPDWAGLPLYDAHEWIVYVGEKGFS